METCIATRRTNVMDAMAGHESLLHQISLTGAKKDALMENAQTDFNTAQQELTRAIDTSQYSGGRDKLNITTPLLAALNVQLQISSLSDLETIKTLSAPEITDVLKDDNLSDDIVNTLSTVENLVVFITETSPEKSAVFLQNLSSRLIGRLINSPMDLSALLISLDLEKCKIAFQSLGRVIRSEQDLDTVLTHLSPEQKATLISLLSDQEKIRFQFYRLRTGVTLNEQTVILENIKNHLPELMGSTFELVQTLSSVSLNNRTIVLDVMKDTLPRLIGTIGDFTAINWPLSKEQRTIVLEALKDKWSRLISSVASFQEVMVSLSIEQKAIVFESIKDRLPGFIGSGSDFVTIAQFLSIKQRAIVFESLLPKLAKAEGSYVTQFMLFLTPAEQQQVKTAIISAFLLNVMSTPLTKGAAAVVVMLAVAATLITEGRLTMAQTAVAATAAAAVTVAFFSRKKPDTLTNETVPDIKPGN